MSRIYFIVYRVYFLRWFYVTKASDVKLEGIEEIQHMDHLRSIEKTLSDLNKNRRVRIINFIPMMIMPELKNPDV